MKAFRDFTGIVASLPQANIDTDQIIPELRAMMGQVHTTYLSFNKSFPDHAISPSYLELYNQAISFVNKQPEDYSQFDHFNFVKEYITSPSNIHNDPTLDHSARHRDGYGCF